MCIVEKIGLEVEVNCCPDNTNIGGMFWAYLDL